MAQLSFEEFTKKYILEIGGQNIAESIKDEMGDTDMEMIEMVLNTVAQSFYQDYLENKLDFIDDEDKP